MPFNSRSHQAVSAVFQVALTAAVIRVGVMTKPPASRPHSAHQPASRAGDRPAPPYSPPHSPPRPPATPQSGAGWLPWPGVVMSAPAAGGCSRWSDRPGGRGCRGRGAGASQGCAGLLGTFATYVTPRGARLGAGAGSVAAGTRGGEERAEEQAGGC